MNALNEKTACMPSVGADAGQSINNLKESIPTGAGECKGNLHPPLQVVPIRGKHFDTVTMEELFDTVYDSTPPVIDGLLYNGVSIIAGSGKVGKSFQSGFVSVIVYLEISGFFVLLSDLFSDLFNCLILGKEGCVHLLDLIVDALSLRLKTLDLLVMFLLISLGRKEL